ncbi:STAS domain-containing protein [Nannocystis bainbridge]|uniref:STAS domain-containing protein n=1 Tax=Nannocystis bainbridge TaxID=2995303 RepID=A0ABT5E6C9_9BACT|nr:STAS domain-containing protein [Nannocystis bainbridge]MDC0721417.1 STAS domain-containing protein [Nannocystis bainbridge]
MDAFRGRLNDNVAASAARIRAAKLPFYEGLTDPQLSATLARAFEAVALDLAHGEPQALLQRMREIAVVRSQLGVAVMDVVTGLNLGFQAVSDDFAAHHPDEPELRLGWERARAKLAYAGAAVLADTYLQAREAVVRAQSEALVRLSLRVLPLYPGVVVLPLLGELGAERAQQITEALLAAVARHSAAYALIDLSGVPSLDTDEAVQLLARAAQAIELLGATPVLVGIQPAVAQSMSARGVSFRAPTLADLASGLRYALRGLGVELTQTR